MRKYRLMIHAMILPKFYIAYLLIKNAPNKADPEIGIQEQNYYVGMAILFCALLLLLYGSFVTRRMKRVPLHTKAGIGIAFIIALVLVDTGLIYYLKRFAIPVGGFLS